MKRTLVIGALVTAGLVAACDDDSMGPGTTGSISIHVTVAPPPAAPAAGQPSVSTSYIRAIAAPRLPSKSDGAADSPTMQLRAASGTDGAAAVDRRVVRINTTPQEQTEGETSQPEAPPAASEPAPPAAPAAPSAIDNATLKIIGPTNRTLEDLAPGSTHTVEDLNPGSYTVVLEGNVGGQVDHFAIVTGVQVRAEQDTPVNMTFYSFRPAIGAITSPTTAVPFLFSWPSVPNATSYVVQLDGDPGFPNPVEAQITETSAIATVVQPGTYYVRVRAFNSTHVPSGGRWGDYRSVQVIEDTQSGPNPAGAAYIGFMDGQGPMTVTDLNILPDGDQDWFSVRICELDVLKIETFARRLSRPSPLNTQIELWDPSASTMIAENDDIDFAAGNLDSYIEAQIPADGDYRIGVFGVSSDPVGSYELTVDVVRGPNNDGTQCTTVHGPAEVVVTPAGASIVGVGGTQQFSAEAFDDRGDPLTGLTFTWTSLNPGIATVNASGLLTAVANGQVVIEAETDGVKGYAVATVTVPGTTRANLWANFAGFGVHGWGASESDIWVCSAVDEMSHWNGTAWTAFPVTMPGCREVWGTGPDDVFVAGITGSMIHWDGSQWTSMTTGTAENLAGLWGSAPNNVYATGGAGTILHYDGSSWTPQTSSTTEILGRVWGTAADNIYAVGSAGAIVHYDGGSWSSVTSPTSEVLRGIWGSAPTEIVVVGNHGVLLWFDGTWNVVPTATTDSLLDVGGANSSDLYAVGLHGELWYYNGSTFQKPDGPSQNALWDVWAAPNGDMYAFGNDGLFRGYRGATVSVTGPTYTLTQVGQQVQLTAAASRGGNPISGVQYAWRSDNESVATVDGNGLVTAVAQGTANIWADAPGGAQAVRPITVQIPAYVVVTPGGTTVSGLGNTFGFSAQAFDAGNNPVNGLTYTWSTLNPNIATIGAASGVATAVEVGQTVVRVSTTGVVGHALLTVTNPSATRLNVWSTMSSPVTTYLYGVWGTAANNVYAVGEGGTIVRFNGTSWSSMTSGTTNFLRDVSGLSANEIYAVGDGGVILRYNGTSWSTMSNPTTDDLYRVWAASPTSVFAVGVNGRILRYNGSAWATMTSPTTNQLIGVWGTSATDVFAVGISGTVIHYDGNSWTTMTSPTGNNLYGLWGTASNNVFAVGFPGQISRYNGSSWSNMTSPTTAFLWSLWGTSGSDVYTVGNSGTIMQYNGSTWEIMGSPTPNPIRAIWGTSQGSVFAVGANGTILRGGRGASVASVTVTPAGASVSGVGSTGQFTAQPRDASGNPISFETITWSSLNTAVATVNQSGTATAQRDGQVNIRAATGNGRSGTALLTVSVTGATAVNVWSRETLPVSMSTVRDVWGLTPNLAYAVGSGGNILRFDGSSWSAMTSNVPGTVTLFGVWGSASNDVFAVGDGGTIAHYNGSAWSLMTNPDANGLWDVWGSGPNDVYAIGNSGTLMHYDGTAWTRDASFPGTSTMYRVWGTARDNVYVVGITGQILRWNGTSWSAETSGTTQLLAGIWGTAANNMFAAGSNGTLLRNTGGGWTSMTSPVTTSLYGLWGSSPSDVYNMGENSPRILRYNGTSWSTMTSTETGYLWSAWGTYQSNVFAVGAGGVLRGVRGAAIRNYGNSTQLPDPNSHGANYLLGYPITVTNRIELTHLAIILAGAGNQVKVGLYTDVGGNPSQLIVQGAATVTAAGDYRIAVPQTGLAPGTYWLMAVYDVSTSVATQSLTGGTYRYISHTFANPLPTTIVSPISGGNQDASYYVRGYVIP